MWLRHVTVARDMIKMIKRARMPGPNKLIPVARR
jgi:hypothetical protein